MTSPAELTSALAAALGCDVAGIRRQAGGSINDAFLASLDGGEEVFVKVRADATPEEFETEAAGLRWLSEGPVPVPEVLAVGSMPPMLALSAVESGSLSAAGAERFGRALAGLHRLGAPAHGWLAGGAAVLRLGSVPLKAEPAADWASVYAEQRLLPLARMARDSGALSGGGARAVGGVCERIEELAGPAEPPARLHGDLWSGNVHADAGGEAWLIDPAAHGGHRETDLAMLALFGAPHLERIAAAYAEVAPLTEGHERRLGLWQLQPLLVHAVLFGGHYGGSAERLAGDYL